MASGSDPASAESSLWAARIGLLAGPIVALAVFFLGSLVLDLAGRFIKIESESGFKTWYWVSWAFVWLLFLLKFAGLLAWTAGAFLVRGAARN